MGAETPRRMGGWRKGSEVIRREGEGGRKKNGWAEEG